MRLRHVRYWVRAFVRGCVGGMYVRAIMRACLVLRVARLEVVDKLRFDIGRANRHGWTSKSPYISVGFR